MNRRSLLASAAAFAGAAVAIRTAVASRTRQVPASAILQEYAVPRGSHPHDVAPAPDGTVWYVSLAGSYLGRVDPETGATTVAEPPTPRQGARRVWPDSQGFLWISEWNAGQAGRFDPSVGAWREWKLPGARPQAYAVYVDERDAVWLTDWGTNA